MNINWQDYSDPTYFIKELEVDATWIKDFGKDYHAYRRIWRKASDDFIRYDFPLCLEVETSYACNFKCPQCPRNFSDLPKQGMMATDTFEKIVRECKEKKLNSIFLDHGGEALMNRNLPNFVKMWKDAGIIDIMISTNASLLTRKLSRALIQNGVTKINFSIDAATTKIYEKVRPGGVYDKVIRNVEAFLDEKQGHGKSYPRVRVSFIVQEHNKREIELFYAQWEKRVNVISFQKYLDYKKILGENENDVQPEAFDYQCYQPFTNLMIDYKGGIHVCNHDYNHRYILGKIDQDTLTACWQSETMEELRNAHRNTRWSDIELCKNCVIGSM